MFTFFPLARACALILFIIPLSVLRRPSPIVLQLLVYFPSSIALERRSNTYWVSQNSYPFQPQTYQDDHDDEIDGETAQNHGSGSATF